MIESRFKPYDPCKCLNCDTSFGEDTVFCPSCGQKNRKNELSLREWIREALSTFFHLEGKTLNTVRDLVVPGKMAYNYFNGQRQRYVHPFRLLVFSSLICFGLMSFQRYYFPDDDGPKLIQISGPNLSTATKVSVGDSIAAQVIEDAEIHPIASRMKDIDLQRAQIIYHDRFELIADSLGRAGALQDSAQLALLDSLRNFFQMPAGGFGTNFFVSNGDSIKVDPRKVAGLSAAEVVADSDIKGWLTRLIARKGIHAYQEGAESLQKRLYGNLSWAVLIYVPFLALGYKLFYRRKLPLYTQHLTYSAILMSIALLLYGATTLIDTFLPYNILSVVGVLVFIVYNFISDRRVFRVSKLHAFAKLNLLGLYGFFAFMISLLIWFLVTMIFV